MKYKSTHLTLAFLIAGTLFTACMPIQKTQTSSNTTKELDGQPTNVQREMSENISENTETPTSNNRFTIEADDELKTSVAILYEAFFPDDTAMFVENGGDLVVTKTYECPDERPCILPTYLPESVMIQQSDKTDVYDFIAFAISIEGQQQLIDAGELLPQIKLDDQAGSTLEIPQPVSRVISTYGPATSFIYSVHAQDRLVSASYLGARDPKGAAVMEKMDSRFPEIMGDKFFTQTDFNVEQAAVLNPDLIVTSARTSWIEAADQLGLDVFLFNAETPERLKEAMQLTGKIFGPHSAAIADAWISYFDGSITAIQDQIAGIPEDQRVRVLFTGMDPLKVVSGDMYQTDIILAAGGISVSSELNGYWNDVNIEQVVLWNPDVIIVPPYGGASVEAITESSEWQILVAVQEGRVYQMPKLVVPWDTPAPDSVLGIVWIAQLINSESINIDCVTEAEYFYNTFYNYPITAEELAAICKFE
ncbi:MAG: ABC transporter substrate-binding protein [Chloroflexota bacterium]|nr:ABC transporter substrate-binding protein [Chloroflexota bacterium]